MVSYLLSFKMKLIKGMLIKERRILAAALLSGLIFTLAAGVLVTRAYSDQVSEDIARELIRFHVRANSDSDEDQALKEYVKENILHYLRDGLAVSSSKAESYELLYSRLGDVESYAREIIKEKGYDYQVSAKLTREFFPTKIYGDIALPAGEYDSLRVDIGLADGNNWWCVMFPPLCYVDVAHAEIPTEEKEKLREILNSESYELVAESAAGDIPVKIKFKIVELWQSLKPDKDKVKVTNFAAKTQLPKLPLNASATFINSKKPDVSIDLPQEKEIDIITEPIPAEIQPAVQEPYEATQPDFADSINEDDLFLLACIINGEARGESYDGQVAVGAVVMNRVAHKSFPNTIREVIYQPGAFDAVWDGQINLKPTDSCLQAAREALSGSDPTDGALYYWNPRTATSRWIQNINVTMAIGNHNFGMH